jgi:hypothetical protein
LSAFAIVKIIVAIVPSGCAETLNVKFIPSVSFAVMKAELLAVPLAA